MSDIKWIKINTNMFEDEKIKLIDAMPERDTIHYIWVRLLAQAGKTNSNGYIFLSEDTPYTDEMLSTIFSRPLTSIRLALKTLKNFGMIKIDENNFIKITNWHKHQNIEGMEKVREQNKIRAKNFRDRKKQIKKSNTNINKGDLHKSIDKESIIIKPTDIDADENNHNVMKNKNNVTVTEQNKRESKNKKENKNKNSIIDRDKEVENKYLLLPEKKDDINLKSNKLLKHYENLTGTIDGINLGAIKLAVSSHGVNNVKMAINKAFEANKTNMRYINGILKNWKREGYPNCESDYKNHHTKTELKLKFNNFEAREYDYDSLEKLLLQWN